VNQLNVLWLQMSVESARYEYIRQHEWPFNSDTKYMAVMVTPRRSQVGFCSVDELLLLSGRVDPSVSRFLGGGAANGGV